MCVPSAPVLSRDSLPIPQGLQHAVVGVGVAAAEGLGQARFQLLAGWRRAGGFELVDQQHQ